MLTGNNFKFSLPTFPVSYSGPNKYVDIILLNNLFTQNYIANQKYLVEYYCICSCENDHSAGLKERFRQDALKLKGSFYKRRLNEFPYQNMRPK